MLDGPMKKMLQHFMGFEYDLARVARNRVIALPVC